MTTIFDLNTEDGVAAAIRSLTDMVTSVRVIRRRGRETRFRIVAKGGDTETMTFLSARRLATYWISKREEVNQP